jgi:hypothetical protein
VARAGIERRRVCTLSQSRVARAGIERRRVCALSLSKGGQGRNRTGDLSLFRRTLLPTELPGLVSVMESITSYATPTGLEPATSAVTGRRANQLRHGALWPRVRTLPGARETIAQHMDWAVSRTACGHQRGRPPTLAHAMVAVLIRSPSSSGLGLRPFKAAARVRIPLGTQDQSPSDKVKLPVRQ